jgi:hypothetical protein
MHKENCIFCFTFIKPERKELMDEINTSHKDIAACIVRKKLIKNAVFLECYKLMQQMERLHFRSPASM